MFFSIAKTSRKIQKIVYKIHGMPRMFFIYEDAEDSISQAMKRGDSSIFIEFEDIAKFIPPGSTVLDIGAHIGVASVFYRSLGHRIVSFEASRENALLLNMAREANAFDRWSIVNAAVSDQNGMVPFYSNGPSGHIIVGNNGSKQSENVESIALDKWLASHSDCEPIGLVKMDIEGAEVAALQGASTLFCRRDAPRLFIESNGHCLDWFKETPKTLRGIIARYGYEIFGIYSKRLLRPTAFYPVVSESLQARCCVNYFCVKDVIGLKAQGARIQTIYTMSELMRDISKALDSNNIDEQSYLVRALSQHPDILYLPTVQKMLQKASISV